jgi:peptidoglycan hydrolase CwlO-like protein
VAARRLAVLLLTAAAYGALVAASSADLTSRYQAGQQRSAQLRSRIHAETSRIQGFEGTIGALQHRLDVVQSSVAVQEELLGSVSDQLAGARVRLAQLRSQYTHDLAALAAQLRANYEAPPPTVVGVVVDANGFTDLLNGLSNLTVIERRNTQVALDVKAARAALATEAARLAVVQARRRRSAAAVLAERDTIAQLKLSIVDRELAVVHARDADTGRLRAVQATLVHEAQILDARAAAAQTLTSGGAVAPPGGCANTPFVPHGGEFGFFPAPGTNYSVNQEPIIAARLDQLGQALQLHLIGISGYRTPQHSVEVGGFADDPHTRGEASDTPGVEGVPESTLEEFCLTRPFPGAREADHIQELP